MKNNKYLLPLALIFCLFFLWATSIIRCLNQRTGNSKG